MPWLSEALEEVVERIGIKQSVLSDRARDVWKEAVGDLINSNTTLENIEKNKIIVIVSNESWRKELLDRKEEIIMKINDLIGENAIKDIIFR
ncbi:DUF721 domain-containing protein [Candidatus Marinimicrobia bacterium MT.SAG.2]|nr:DUF721 domain-containing protein [Candidatus Neomarinimicrobiota bacterium]TFB10369.1 DUF721 domain-containing protein [Candidatus Marinimicrobia bacterium MT.SAG.2]